MPRNQGDNETTHFQRSRIVALFEEGKSERWIARELGLSRCTVHRWVVRWQDDGHVNDEPRKGRPRATTAQQDEKLFATLQKQPFIDARALQRELELECSDQTVRNRLREAVFQPIVVLSTEARHNQQPPNVTI